MVGNSMGPNSIGNHAISWWLTRQNSEFLPEMGGLGAGIGSLVDYSKVGLFCWWG